MIPIHHGTPAAVEARVREEFVEHLCLVNEDFNHEKRALLEENDALAVENVALRKEADLYRAAEEAQIALRAKMEQERDALAAHLEQLSYLIVDAKRCAAVLAFPLNYNAPDYQSFAKDVMSTIEALSKKEPIASLACRDLIQRAEELEEFAAGLPKFSAMGMEKALILKARERRKQAEGHQ